MDAQLTSEDNTVRARAVLLLSEVRRGPGRSYGERWPELTLHAVAAQRRRLLLRPAPGPVLRLQAGGLVRALRHARAVAVAEEAPPRPTLRGALSGSLFLLRCVRPSSALDEGAAAELVSALLREVHVPSLAAADRLLALDCLSALVAQHPGATAGLGARLLEGAIAAVDGEKDPRCLGCAFALWPPLAALFPPDSAPMRACCEEMHDVVACYFPLVFNAPAGGGGRAPTRAALAAALAAALTASPAFAPFAMQLILGRLTVAGGGGGEGGAGDCLAALRCALTAFPPAALVPHAHALWRALRASLLPAMPGEEGPAGGAQALAAAQALTHALRALGAAPGGCAQQLVAEALGDPYVADVSRLLLQGSLAGAGAGADAGARLRAHAASQATGLLLAAVARSSIHAARCVCCGLLPPALAASARQPGGLPPRQALRLVQRCVVAACDAALHAQRAAGGAQGALGAPYGPHAADALSLFLRAAAAPAEQDEAEEDGEIEDVEWVEAGQEGGAVLLGRSSSSTALGVAGLQALLLTPAACDALDVQGRGQAARALAAVAVLGVGAALRCRAASALAAVARSPDAQSLLAHAALPPLLRAACEEAGAEGCDAALTALCRLAEVAPSTLAPLAADALAACVRDALEGRAPADTPLLLRRLEALQVIFPVLPPSAEAQAAAASFALCALRCCAEPRLAAEGMHAALAGAACAASGAVEAVAQAPLAAASVAALSARPPASDAQLLVAAAIACALRPGAPVASAAPAQLVAALVACACNDCGAGPLRTALLHAAASLVNKAADSDAVAAALLDGWLLPRVQALCGGDCDGDCDAQLAACASALGALAQGLALRAAPRAFAELPAALLALLRLPQGAWPATLAAAAHAYAQPLRGLPAARHSLARPLFSQRYLGSALPALLASLRGVGGCERTGGLLALAQLVRAAPRGPLLAACAQLAALLPECLGALGGDAPLLAAVTAATCDLLCEPQGRLAAAEQAGPLLAALGALAVPAPLPACGPPAALRLTALQGLTAAAELPYASTFPHRRQLLRVLALAVDDPRRRVREAAVAARTVWAALPDA